VKIFSVLVVLFVATFSFAQKDSTSFLCVGSGIIYTTTAPKGWKLDNESGKPNKLCLVAYPEKSSWENGENVVYFNASPKGKEEGSRDLDEMIIFDIAQHRKVEKKLEIKDGATISLGQKKVKTKYFFNHQKNGNFEAVGYIPEQSAVVFVVMSSRSKKGFERSLPAFKEFIRNYKYMGIEAQVTEEAKPQK
jgi:hypothetical protein